VSKRTGPLSGPLSGKIGQRLGGLLAGIDIDPWPVGPPNNLIKPAILGTLMVGETLTVDTGVWDSLVTGYGYQWTLDGIAIAGATTSIYSPQAGDAGHSLSVLVTATGYDGSTTVAATGGGIVQPKTEDGGGGDDGGDGGGDTPIPLTIAGSGVTAGYQNDAYAGFTVVASGGTGTITYSLVGSWPAGITVNPDTGVVSGTPTGFGSFTGLSVRATDGVGATADIAAFTLTVTEQMVIVFTPPSDGQENSPILDVTVIVTGGDGPLDYELVGDWPDGIDIDPGTGEISGTPIEPGTFSGLIIQVTDQSGHTASSAPFTLTVAAETFHLLIDSDGANFQMEGGDLLRLEAVPPNVLTLYMNAVTSFTRGDPVDGRFFADFGTPPYSYAVTSGALPAGVSLNSATGRLEGVVNAHSGSSGAVTVLDAASHMATLAFSFTVTDFTGFYAAAMNTGTAITLTTVNTPPLAAVFDVNISDTAGLHSTAAGLNTRFVVPAKWHGRYVRFMACHAATQSIQTQAYRNNIPFSGQGRSSNSVTTGNDAALLISAPVPANGFDWFELFYFATIAGTFETAAWAQLELMPADYNGALVGKSVSQALTAGVTATLSWDVEAYDLGSWHDNVTNNSRMTVPSGVSLVRLSASIRNTAAATGEVLLSMLKNGTSVRGLPRADVDVQSATVEEAISVISAPLSVTAGDYFEVQALLTSSGDSVLADSGVWFSIEKLSPTLKYALVNKTGSQPLSAGVATTLTWDAEVANVGGWHSNVTNNSRLTVPSGVTRVRVTGNAIGTNVAGQAVLSILKNGATFSGTARDETDTATTDALNVVSIITNVVAGDYFELQATWATASALSNDVQTWFAIEEVLPTDDF
jgi:hypothetical protein